VIDTNNNFPTAAGLASSASGFAALVTAIDAACELQLQPSELSRLARIGSGSAARSIHGGFVALAPPTWQAKQLATPEHWPLTVAVAITDTGPKTVSSSAGMERSRTTSPYYSAWVQNNSRSFDTFIRAIAERNFSELAELSEASCLDMHALMLSSRPGLIYWRPATLACIHRVRELRAAGVPVFFTVDAGPQIKAICQPDALDAVCSALAKLGGVHQVLRTGLGRGARLVAP
jgi:diphosphomevalonate decarboxylase|tara:strand:- start:150 stop:848 length:699 start_codon:yes stop_codon:yes gene_type:complete